MGRDFHQTVNTLPRRNNYFFSPVSLALIFILATSAALAQRRVETRSRQPASTTDSSKEVTTGRRAQAIALLNQTADKARTFDDLLYRARIQALAADALWRFDEARARAIFRRAWEAATASDKAAQEAEEIESGGTPGSVSTAVVTDSRNEVLAKAAAHDRALAEAFLNDLNVEKEGGTNLDQNQTSPSNLWHEPGASGQRRLALAFELLNQGESKQAAQIAAPPANEGVSSSLILFILRLHEQDAAAADALYRVLLQRTGNDREADVNALLLLSAPIISPELLVVFDERGSLLFRPVTNLSTQKSGPTPFAPPARQAFYRLAATVLLRPRASFEDPKGRTEAVALYFATGRLLPFFENEAAQYAPELRARLNVLAAELDASRRDMLSTQLDLHRLTPSNPGDPLGPQLVQLSHARDAAERDRVRLAIMKTAARYKLWDRARHTATEIQDEATRRAALSFIVVNQIADIRRTYAEDDEDDFESLAKFVSNADAPAFAKAWGFAEAAEIAARKKAMPRALELLNEAEHQAALVDHGTLQRVAAYLVLTGAAAHVNAGRAWELLAEAIKAANALEDYAGDERALDLWANAKSPENVDSAEETADHLSIESEAFRLDKIFATMTPLDFGKALTNARDLDGDVPQALASIAIARAATERVNQNRSQNSAVRNQK